MFLHVKSTIMYGSAWQIKENAWFGSNHMQMVSQAKEGLSLIEYERSKSLILYNLQNTLSWFLPGHRLEKAAGLHTLFISNCVFSLCTYHQRQFSVAKR